MPGNLTRRGKYPPPGAARPGTGRARSDSPGGKRFPGRAPPADRQMQSFQSIVECNRYPKSITERVTFGTPNPSRFFFGTW